MRILFDNNVPHGLRFLLPGHKVRTIIEMHWSPQLKNGELLLKAEESGFQVFLTADQNISYQQNLSSRKLAMVVLGSNYGRVVRIHAAPIMAAIKMSTPGSHEFVPMPATPKPPDLRER